jgi:small-conductance mechanosensitive channel
MSFDTLGDALTRIYNDIVNFIPNLINGLIILIIGYLIARFVRWLMRFILQRVKFDPLIERSGLTGTMRGLGVKTPISEVVAGLVFFFLMLSFTISAVRLMGLEPVARLLEQILAFLPNLIAAVIVLMLGGVIAKFTGDLVTTVATGADLSYARVLGRIVQYLISLFVLIVALGALGVDTTVLVTSLPIIIASFGLALGLALGLGARFAMQNIIAGYYLRQRFSPGQPIRLGSTGGTLTSIGPINSVLSTPEGETIIPNTALTENQVLVPNASDTTS